MSDRPLRILHLLLAADAGGLSRYVLDLMAAMQARGHHVEAAGDRGAWQSKFRWDRFEEIPLKAGALGFWRSVRDVRKLLAQRQFDVIHTHYRRATLLARRLKSDLPILYTLHLSHLSLSWPRRWLSDWGDHTHVASLDAQRWLIDEAGVKSDRITYIPHGVDTERFSIPSPAHKIKARMDLGLAPTDRVAIFVGRFEYPKNEDWLLDLALPARSIIPELKILLVGGGPNEPQLRERVKSASLQDCVVILPDTNLISAYHAADALLLPSLREGFSLVCAEAMSCGLPCLRTRTSGTQELIVENVTGQSTPIEHDEFVKSALAFLSSPARLREMGLAAARHIREHFTYDRQVDRTIELYEKLIEKK